MSRNARGWSIRALSWLLALVVICAGCGAGEEAAVQGPAIEQDELNEIIEDRLELQLPVISPEELELFGLKRDRRRLAEDMGATVAMAMVPLALMASLFAIEGASDLVLAITPFHKLGRVRDIFKNGRKFRKRQKKYAKKLEEFAEELDEILEGDLGKITAIAQKATKVEIRALQAIRSATKSAKVTCKLLHSHVKGTADVEWIAEKLKEHAIDKDFVRRFTFDADWVREFTEHSAYPSWNALRDVVKNQASTKARASIASKVTGLLGEQAAAAMVRTKDFKRRFFGNDRVPVSLGRGVGYGSNRSLDIAAFGPDKGVFVEVKNWSSGTWADESKRNEIIDQLKHHNDGIKDFSPDDAFREKSHKLLMVRQGGYESLKASTQEEFKKEIDKLGWAIELIPDSQILDFGELIDALK